MELIQRALDGARVNGGKADFCGLCGTEDGEDGFLIESTCDGAIGRRLDVTEN